MCAGAVWDSSYFFLHQAARVHSWPSSGLSFFTRIYDDDTILVDHDVDWDFSVDLCSLTVLPCSLTIGGDCANKSSRNCDLSRTIRRLENSTITCDAGKGCTGFSVEGVTVSCGNQISRAPPLQVSGSGASVTITNSVFQDCSSEAGGGAIQVLDGAVVIVSGSSFLRSFSTSDGGAMSVLGAQASIVDSSFLDCRAPEGRGGALLVQNFPAYPSPLPSTVRLQGCQLSRNSADEGGSLALVGRSSEAVILDCSFTANWATQSGGAVAVIEFGQASISESTFDDNRASGPGGGALYATSSSVELAANLFSRNSALGGGGGTLLWNGNLCNELRCSCKEMISSLRFDTVVIHPGCCSGYTTHESQGSLC